MLTRRRALAAVALLLLVALVWTAWLAYQTAHDLRSAEQAVDRIRAAVSAEDSSARTEAIEELEEAAGNANDRTSGWWWSALTRAPIVGDDMGGIQDLSNSLNVLAVDAFGPLGETVDELDSVVAGGRINLDKLEDIAPKVATAHGAFATAAQIVEDRDSAGFAGVLRSRYERYVSEVSQLARDLGSAEDSLQVLPTMLGGSDSRQYLLIFENNAEIRATGGLPGSWALVKAEDGKLSMTRQGSAGDFSVYREPIGDITPSEEALFGREIGRFFQDPNFTPDFPRAAEIFNEFWAGEFPGEPIDGVISIDTVALSYVLEGTGPVESGGFTLTPDNVVQKLLSEVYKEPDTSKQDEVFRNVARAVFDSATSDLEDPIALLEGIARATREGRFKVAPFTQAEAKALDGTRILGQLAGDEGATPHIDIAFNDATASKMSYYLRYRADARSLSCDAGRQRIALTISLSESISASDAKSLPPYVTGKAPAGVAPGSQLVRAHVFAPFGGSFSNIKINGQAVAAPRSIAIDGRTAMTLNVLVEPVADAIVTLDITSGLDQDADGVLGLTPSVVTGGGPRIIPNSC